MVNIRKRTCILLSFGNFLAIFPILSNLAVLYYYTIFAEFCKAEVFSEKISKKTCKIVMEML